MQPHIYFETLAILAGIFHGTPDDGGPMPASVPSVHLGKAIRTTG
jgi:hypothetical protein